MTNQVLSDKEIAAVELAFQRNDTNVHLYIPALIVTVRELQQERLEIQRALASSVLNDPTEDDDPLYSTTELVGGIRDLIARKESLLTRSVAQKTELTRLQQENERLSTELTKTRQHRDDLIEELK